VWSLDDGEDACLSGKFNSCDSHVFLLCEGLMVGLAPGFKGGFQRFFDAPDRTVVEVE
jgi:hypothetical protein